MYHVEPNVNVYSYLKNEHGYKIPMLEIDGSFVGLQFHPEFSTKAGLATLIGLVEKRRELLIEENKDPNKIVADLLKIELGGHSHPSLKFLTNFVDFCLSEKNTK